MMSSLQLMSPTTSAVVEKSSTRTNCDIDKNIVRNDGNEDIKGILRSQEASTITAHHQNHFDPDEEPPIRLTFPEIWVESFCESSEDEEALDTLGPGTNRGEFQNHEVGRSKQDTKKGEKERSKVKVIRTLLTSSTDVSFESLGGSCSSSSSRQNSFQLCSRDSSIDLCNGNQQSNLAAQKHPLANNIESSSRSSDDPAVSQERALVKDPDNSSRCLTSPDESGMDRLGGSSSFHTPEASQIDQWIRNVEKFGFSDQDLKKFETESNMDDDDTWFEEGLTRIFDPYYDLDPEDIKEVVGGKRDHQGRISGKCTIKLVNGDEILGTFRNGLRYGKGSIEGDNLYKHGIICINGNYTDSLLRGRGRVIIKDGGLWPMVRSRLYLDGVFNEGYLEGPVRGLDDNGRLAFVGSFLRGLPNGHCWLAKEGQGWLHGQVDARGRFSGDNIAFLFPDKMTCMLGQFKDEVMIKTISARIEHAQVNESLIMSLDIRVPGLDDESKQKFYSWSPSTNEDITCDWLLPDCFETVTVICRPSNVRGAGEGLFSQKDIPAGKIVAYYNGIRVKPGESYQTKNFDYQIYVDWANTDNSAFVDVPLACTDISVYKASLAHKANHSFDPNCKYVAIDHPRFGRIPGLKTIQNVKKGDELFSHYKYDMALAPKWYTEAWENFKSDD